VLSGAEHTRTTARRAPTSLLPIPIMRSVELRNTLWCVASTRQSAGAEVDKLSFPKKGKASVDVALLDDASQLGGKALRHLFQRAWLYRSPQRWKGNLRRQRKLRKKIRTTRVSIRHDGARNKRDRYNKAKSSKKSFFRQVHVVTGRKEEKTMNHRHVSIRCNSCCIGYCPLECSVWLWMDYELWELVSSFKSFLDALDLSRTIDLNKVT
jgi:hypothetical protein